MDSAKITELAQLLRNSGDKVLNDRYKLTLSVQLLRGLSDSFRIIVDDADEFSVAGGNGSVHGAADASHFQVVSKYHNAKTPEMRDLQLIYDFVQKTRILCVTNFTAADDNDQQSSVDISKFRNLRRLEICKLNVGRVRGIQKMRAHLQELRCVHSIGSVEEIISHCGGDRCNGFMWNELHTVDFSYNTLRSVDGSLEFVTSLQHLNLSHNQIVSVDAIKWLKNLKYLNLSFNRLPFVPTLHVEAPRRLKVLILSNNHIEDVTGISRLDALCELDLSDNYLLDHSALLPLSTLIALQVLNVSGNPLACHPKHRQLTAKYLHKNTASGKFSLDNELLSKYEKNLTGQHQSLLNHARPMPFFSFSRRSTVSSNIASSSRRTTTDNSPASSLGSMRSFRMDDSLSTIRSAAYASGDIVHRKIRPKTATIAEHPGGAQTPEHRSDEVLSTVLPPALRIDECTAHLETKRRIEEMCRQYGDSWLQSHGAKIMGHSADARVNNMLCKPTSDEKIDRVILDTEERLLDVSETSVYKTALDLSVLPANDTSSFLATSPLLDTGKTDVAEPPHNIVDTVTAMAPEKPAEQTLFIDDPPSDPEENEVMYIVTLQPSLADMMLVVSTASIREKDALTGATVTKWSMSALESCDRTRTDVLRLNFATVNRDRRERIYRVETGLCQRLERYLRGILAQRPLSEMNQVVYKCIKCGVSFSRELHAAAAGKQKKATPQCPNCGSEFLVEMQESPRVDKVQQQSSEVPAAVPVQPPPSTIATDEMNVGGAGQSTAAPEAPFQGSESRSSIAPNKSTATTAEWTKVSDPYPKPMPMRSAQSLNEESSSCSRISKSSSSFDSNRSTDGSLGLAGRCRRAADFAAEQRRSADESDVEILSNPSQSSIEVLDRSCGSEGGRKHSEEYAYHSSLLMELSLDSVTDQINRLSVSSTATADALAAPSAIQHHQQTSTRDLLQLQLDAQDQAMISDGQRTAIVTTPTTSTATVNTATTVGALQTQVPHHLTESSSSGSVTDSICTTYDQNQRTITNSNSSSINGADALQRSPEKPAASSTAGGANGSMITSMLGGLFQSTNSLMSRSQRTNKNSDRGTTAATTEPFKFSYVDFEEVDHRLKLYLYQTVFEDDNEQLKWLVRGQMLLERPVAKWRYGAAIFVMSTTKFYVLQCVAAENDDVSKWVRRQLSGTIDRLQVVQVLPWKIGLSMEIKGIGAVHLLLQDFLRTDRLLLFLDKNPLPVSCALNYQPAESLAHQLLLTTDNTPLKLLAILAECSCAFSSDATTANDNQPNEDSSKSSNAVTAPTTTTTLATEKLLGLIVTETHLYLLEPAHRWLLPENTSVSPSSMDAEIAEAAAEVMLPLRIVQQQLMNNLVAAQRQSEHIIRFVYLEEMQDRQEEWTCTFETAENAISTLDAVGQSWERLFGVPLTMTN